MIKNDARGAAFLCSALGEVFTEGGGGKHGAADMKDIQVRENESDGARRRHPKTL